MRLIDADALIKNTILNPCHVPYITKSDIEDASTVDVPDTDIGKWNTRIYMINGHKISVSLCSKCGKGSYDEYAYCPHCGKKMEREEEERNENELEV